MELKHIKTDKCPICKCSTIIKEEIYGIHDKNIIYHYSEEQQEERKFSCGYSTRYIPCYSREFASGDCIYDPKIAAIIAKQKAEVQRIIDFVELNKFDAISLKIAYVEIKKKRK